ncbi:hypothetical protein BC938DRAFT_478843 [Jimgerdemannia flammicorona]|uniref:Uncharacterized protein n=1 Tax=Jimgerdemannia flammicorona TaxID=994334 RepID=A0A433QM66_9FUNG|nr:hypothetical protein BC938DRAFT_478843 [Jimgerdemannia flammicorona]
MTPQDIIGYLSIFESCSWYQQGWTHCEIRMHATQHTHRSDICNQHMLTLDIPSGGCQNRRKIRFFL